MIDYNSMDEKLVIFGNIFTVSNRLQILLDQKMPDLSAKQWFVLTMLSFFETAPSLITLSKVCDSSYQNIKQITLKLEKKGFVFLEDDKKDKRIKRIVMTDKFEEWTKETQIQAEDFINDLFEPFSKEKISELKESLLLLYSRLGEMQYEEKN